MRISKVASSVLSIIIAATLVNLVGQFALAPAVSENRQTWTDYREQDTLDMLFLGSSIAERGFDPRAVDAVLGTHSFNMASPAQYLEESWLGLQKAVDEHHPATIVLGFEYDTVDSTDAPNPGRAFIQCKDEGDPAAFLSDAFWTLSNPRCYTTTASINWLFPWVENHVGLHPVDIKSNISIKLGGEPDPDATTTPWVHHGQGYSNYQHEFDPNTESITRYADMVERGGFDQEKIELLLQMCDYCRSHGTRLVLAVPPFPTYNIIDYGPAYFDQHRQIKELVESHDALYYDFNLARPELLDVHNPKIYADYQHLNEEGAAAFSTAFAHLLETQEQDGNSDALFYEENEYWDAVSYIDALEAEITPEGETALVKARPFAGPHARIEYQMCVRSEDGWSVFRDWSEETTATFSPDRPGTYEVRINAREVGSRADYSRYREAWVVL